MGFVASQHLDTVREFHLHDFSHISEELLKMRKQLSRALSKLLLKLTDIADLIEDFPHDISTSKGQKLDATEANGFECA
jgi:hypothetical protein